MAFSLIFSNCGADSFQPVAMKKFIDKIDLHRDLEGFKSLATEFFYTEAGLVLQLTVVSSIYVGTDNVAHYGIFFLVHDGVFDVRAFEKNCFYFRRVNFLPTHIDQFGFASQDS